VRRKAPTFQRPLAGQMLNQDSSPDEIVLDAVESLRRSDVSLFPALNALPAPLYVTNAAGVVTYFNPACVGFTGRTPKVGKDRWCVTWKLYTEEGDFLPHEMCPMGEALRQKRPIRGVSAWAERPDGSRVRFLPFPTPIFSDEGEIMGAVNLLLDITDARQVQDLRAQAQHCRWLALSVGDSKTRDALSGMADNYSRKAQELEAEPAATPRA
jgi:PAS domain-containing protein